MPDTKRIEKDWQRRFGMLQPEQVQQWHVPVTSLCIMVAKAEVEAIIQSKRMHALYKGALDNQASYSALARLFSNGIRIAKEIYSLIDNGYPSGASARWRTLHETTIIFEFIRSNLPHVGERYRDHIKIRRHKAMVHLERLSQRHGKPLTADFLREYERSREEHAALLAKYGPKFKDDYGWAKPALGRGRESPRLSDLERAVGMDHVRSVYSSVSRHIHSGADSVPWNLDPARGDDFGRVFGPDPEGSSLPGILTAYTFSNLRISWRRANEIRDPIFAPDLLQKDVSKIISEGVDLVGEFMRCEKDLENFLLAVELSEILSRD